MASQNPEKGGFRGGAEIALVFSLLIVVVLLAMLWKMIDEPTPPIPPISGPAVDCGDDFLGTGDFSGDWSAQPIPNYALSASSEFNGTILLANVDSDFVEAILPSNWSLAEPLDSSELCHPVLILFGEQSNFEVNIGVSNPQGDILPYTEMMLLIPFTQRDMAGPLWHTSVIRMYLNNKDAEDIGNSIYAYAKEEATFSDTGSVFTVYPNYAAAFEANSSSAGPWEDYSVSTLPKLGQITDILAMPLVGIKNNKYAKNGEKDVCSYSDMFYINEGTESRVRSIQTEHRYFSAFVPEMVPWLGLPPISNSIDGAIEIENLVWKIMFPPITFCKYSD